MAQDAGIDRKIAKFITGMIATVGVEYAKKIAAKRFGIDSAAYRFVEQHVPTLAADLNDHLHSIEWQSTRPAIGHDRADYNAGKVAYQRKEWSKAYAAFAKAEEKGDKDAMNYIGLLYKERHIAAEGWTIETSVKMAKWQFEKAIDAGDTIYATMNLNNLGAACANGEAGVKDLAMALACYEKAAAAGYVYGMYNAGQHHMNGWGTVRDLQKARLWLSAVATRSDTEEFRTLAAEACDMLAQIEAQEKQGSNQSQSNGKMTRARALEILDLPDGVQKLEMRSKYMKLMQKLHPDKDGSNFLAKQLNEAREALGF